MQLGIAGAYITNVAFEMLNVDGVEPDDCCIKPYVCFGDMFSKVKWGSFLG